MAEPLNETLTILVIEDDAGDFGLVKAYLRLVGLAAGGAAAAGLVWTQTLAEGIARAQQTAPDIVLLDLSLPDSGGLATLQTLRSALPRAPIVVLTGNDEQTLALAALECGAQDYLVKGQFDPDALGRAIRHARVRGQLEQGLVHSRRLYAALSQCNQAIVRCSSEPELLAQVCRAAVEFGGLTMAWIGLVEPASQRVRPVASFGSGTDYLQGLDISIDAGQPQGRGPVGTAIRSQQPVWCQDFLHDAQTAPWQERAKQFGWRSVAALPLSRQGVVIGSFNLYASDCQAFDDAARRLLQEMASDISFALDNFAKEAQRQQAAVALRESERRMRSFFENAPVGIFLSSREGKFLYVNPAMALILGYDSSQELMDIVNRSSIAEVLYEDPLARKIIVQDVVQSPSHWRTLENRYRRKDGRVIDAILSVGEETDPASGLVNLLGVVIDISQSKEASEHILWLSHFDVLTGLANLSLLGDRFRLAMSMAQRSQRALAIMSLDLDHFKNINDTLGRHTGDAMLVEVARRIQSVVRDEDTVSRQGGDEFVLLLPTTDAAGAAHLAERLLAIIANNYQIDQHELLITPSIGIAMYPTDGTDFETLSKNADIAMYRAKQDGRNGYRFFTPAMQARSSHTLRIENALRRALERGQLSLHYQPQVALASGRVIGAEALLRWTHPELGPVSPADFIPVAEASGQIVQMGEWVLRTAVRQMKAWLEQGLAGAGAPFVMAVNLSVVQFRHPRLLERVMQILQEEQLAPEYLELELTEGVALNDPLGAITVMNALHEHGIRMSIDDFGTGYSSLSYLKRFKVYKLKIDQSFVRDIMDDPEDQAIVNAIISMAGKLGLQTIAEGVETAGQLAFLRDSGCHEVQGYYFSKPLPATAFEAFLRRLPPPE
ncbi:MAG: EAL domain-containing protein [Rhodoferax sp.]